MKLPRLPEIDLANHAARSREDKRASLVALAGRGSWSYSPAREQHFNIFNPRDPMGLAPPKPPALSRVVSEVAKACHHEDQLVACKEVVNEVWRWRGEHVGDAVERTLPGMPIGTVDVVRFWTNFVAMFGGRPTFFFFDYRRANGLTEVGRRVVFSLMHEHIRETYSDLVDVQLAIVKVVGAGKGKRKLTVYTDSDVERFSLSELNAMITETYEVWHEVQLARRAGPARKSAAGGGLF